MLDGSENVRRGGAAVLGSKGRLYGSTEIYVKKGTSRMCLADLELGREAVIHHGTDINDALHSLPRVSVASQFCEPFDVG